jgi:uncharacterized membrane protein HdeD (DUF308 family)
MATVASPGGMSGTAPAGGIPLGTRALLFVVGLVGLAVGVFVIADPNRTLKIVAIVFGIYLLVWGLVRLYRAWADERGRYVSVLLGLIGVAAGVVVLARPTGSLKAVAWAFGIYLIAVGVVELVDLLAARGGRDSVRGLAGLIDLAAGIVVVAWPGIGLYTAALVLGAYLIVRGAIVLLAAAAPKAALERV